MPVGERPGRGGIAPLCPRRCLGLDDRIRRRIARSAYGAVDDSGVPLDQITESLHRVLSNSRQPVVGIRRGREANRGTRRDGAHQAQNSRNRALPTSSSTTWRWVASSLATSLTISPSRWTAANTSPLRSEER